MKLLKSEKSYSSGFSVNVSSFENVKILIRTCLAAVNMHFLNWEVKYLGTGFNPYNSGYSNPFSIQWGKNSSAMKIKIYLKSIWPSIFLALSSATILINARIPLGKLLTVWYRQEHTPSTILITYWVRVDS
jgi:hypothetical protein